MGIIKNTLIYLGFVEDELQEEIASYEDSSPRSGPARPQRQSVEPTEVHDSREYREPMQAPQPQARRQSAVQERQLASVHHLQPKQVPMGQVHIVRPTSYGDAQQIGDRLRSSLPVIVNLEEAEDDLFRRVVAFASGLVYGLDGNIQKLAKRIYLVTPVDMQVSSEDKRRLTEDSGLGF